MTLEGRRDLLALLDRALGRLDLLDLLEADEGEQTGDQDVEGEDDEEGGPMIPEDDTAAIPPGSPGSSQLLASRWLRPC